jgi:hypothetical protein
MNAPAGSRHARPPAAVREHRDRGTPQLPGIAQPPAEMPR